MPQTFAPRLERHALAERSPGAKLLARIVNREVKVGVIGMGYVGLPMALTAAERGVEALGFDIDPDKVDRLREGHSYIRQIPNERVARAVEGGKLDATADFSRAAEADVLLVCVPTPLTEHREPDLRFVVASVKAVAPHLRPGQMVVLESTTYPGTTAEVLAPILAETGLTLGRELFLAYSPEREDPGNADFATHQVPKVVGADDLASLELARAFYSLLVEKVVPVSSSATAEAVKLTENIFRSVNIALVNELKVVFGAMGVDVWEVIDAAKTKPFGFMPFYPGPGLGGHCIPIDPFYLTWKAREFGLHTRFVELAGEINSAMPAHVVDRLAEAVDRRLGLGLSRAKVLLLGAAYKKNVDDTRESPALAIFERLLARGAEVDYHDPHVPEIPPTREHGRLAGRRSVELTAENLAGYDAVLIVTDHAAVDHGFVAEHARLVVDTRNACRDVACGRERIVRA